MRVFDMRIVGWSMGEHAQTELVVSAVGMAVRNRWPDAEVIRHSGRGGQYGSLSFGQRQGCLESLAVWAAGATRTAKA